MPNKSTPRRGAGGNTGGGGANKPIVAGKTVGNASSDLGKSMESARRQMQPKPVASAKK